MGDNDTTSGIDQGVLPVIELYIWQRRGLAIFIMLHAETLSYLRALSPTFRVTWSCEYDITSARSLASEINTFHFRGAQCNVLEVEVANIIIAGIIETSNGMFRHSLVPLAFHFLMIPFRLEVNKLLTVDAPYPDSTLRFDH
jgi:hypothetical protein